MTAKLADGRRPAAVADGEALPLAEGSLDALFSVGGLHAINDLPGCLVQIRRALVADGLFLGVLLGGESLSELRAAMTAAESEVEGGVSPRIAPSVDVRDLGGLLQRAGFALPVVDADRLTVTYDDVFALMRDLRGMAEVTYFTGGGAGLAGAPPSCVWPKSTMPATPPMTAASPPRSSCCS